MAKKIGVALSSGGARGAGHIGVLKALQEARVPIDCLSGSSAGAVVAACFAAGTLGRLEDFLLEIRRRDVVKFFDFHFSKESIIQGKRVSKVFKWLTKNKQFKDLSLPLYIMASDIQSGKEYVFQKGDLVEALLASVCVPPLFCPIKKEKKLLVDGGLFHLLPVEILKKKGCDFVIASTLKFNQTLPLEQDRGLYKRYQALKKKTENFRSVMDFLASADEKGTYPSNFIKTALTCFEWGVVSSEKEERMADLLIKTDMNGVTIFDLYKAEECIRRGKLEAEKQLRKSFREVGREAVVP